MATTVKALAGGSPRGVGRILEVLTSRLGTVILNRDMGVPVDGMVGSDVAVDVHVRRVFLRSRIADRDDRDHMITAARQLHPSRPGALDFPAWDVGRNWCHAGGAGLRSLPADPCLPERYLNARRASRAHSQLGDSAPAAAERLVRRNPARPRRRGRGGESRPCRRIFVMGAVT